MRRNEKKPLRPADRLPPRPVLPPPGRPLVEEALPGRLLVLMSQLHRREATTPDGHRPRGPGVSGPPQGLEKPPAPAAAD